jgi:hypothetical protein
MAKIISDPAEIEKMMNGETNDVKRKELENFLTVCAGNYFLLTSICDIGVIDGHHLDPESCSPIDESLLREAMKECVRKIIRGCKVNGKDGNFSAGFMGSRWMDLNEWARSNGLTYCRCAFYSKKFYEGKWASDKPYRIQITVEKSR